MEKTKQCKLKEVITLIRDAENGNRLPKEDFLELLAERVKLCKTLTDRLFEIHRTINFAAKHKESRLPYKQYKQLCTERQEIRAVLQDAKWDINHYET